ncbi:hypothetical protein AVEN_214165-1 [Araneus ventricosus]|uniref:Uncharacterized protein n=1 Tax=Araneus ventricosus TaxID=182803 RepID=A0A4Y2UHV3_ARAVE|nr:hypothetical protein AVEN_214165-1 [Araneus ventricosus]
MKYFEVLDQSVICDSVSPVPKGPWIKELRSKNIAIRDTEGSVGPIEVLIEGDIAATIFTGRQEKLPCGIKNSAAKISKEEEDLKHKVNFVKRISINDEGRYEVALPWKEDNIHLSSHKDLALKRLQKITAKLKSDNLYQVYENVLKKCSELGIIKEDPPDDVNNFGHYLPHRPVMKPGGSTKELYTFFLVVRKRTVKSLSSHKGGFRCSQQSLLLGAVLKFHLERPYEDPHYNKRILGTLKQSLYVNNVAASAAREEDLYQFIQEVKGVISREMFNLRAWQYTGDKKTSASSVLGILRNRDEECLQSNLERLEKLEIIKVTKGEMLSFAHKIFDPIGVACRVLLV